MEGQARPELPPPEGWRRALWGPRSVGTGLAVVGVALGLAWFFGSSDRLEQKIPATSESSLPMAARDRDLLTSMQERLLGTEAVTELNLDAPTEQDRRFLLEILRTGTRAGRASALRALVLLEEPRAVGVLVRLPGTKEEREAYCAGGLEIVRHQLREVAAELLVEGLAEPPGRVDSRCVEKLSAALELIGGGTSEVLEALLESASPRAQRHALLHWQGSASEEVVLRVMGLANGSDPLTQGLADGFLRRQGYEPEAPGGAP